MPFEVSAYSIDNLKKHFFNKALASEELISLKSHLNYFETYFKEIDAKTLVLEKDYIDRDFLEDYSSYYVRSFKPYDRRCSRLHFFRKEFTSDNFKSVLKGQNDQLTTEDLRKDYLGFMVLKPLPSTIIGKTCVVTYAHEDRRYFPTIRKYTVNLFGIELTVDSLAYQEQDSIVAACASSALWSAFHGTAFIFQHSLPSPVEITKLATVYFPFSNRHFPNKALTGEQMALSIREVGLEPYLYSVNSYDTIKATIYAYLKSKIPVVLAFHLWDIRNNNPGAPARYLGGHAVTVTGFSLGGAVQNSFEGIPDFTMTASKIDKIYVHDDQIGPFARMEFNDSEVQLSQIRRIKALDTTFTDDDNVVGNIKGVTSMVILPLYHKIRIPFESVLKTINHFNKLMAKFTSMPNFDLFEWDIFLSDIITFKKDILDCKEITSGDYREEIVTSVYPKYLWRAIGLRGGERKMELVFDATDIDQGAFFHRNLFYDDIVKKQFEVISSPLLSQELDINVRAILTSLTSATT